MKCNIARGGSSARVKVAFFVGHHQRFTGSQRSLLLLVRALPASIEPLCLFPGEGLAEQRFREAGLPVRIVPPAPALSRAGGALLRAGPLERARLVATALVPYTLRLRRLLGEERAELLHANDARALLLAAPAAHLARIPVVLHVRGDMKRLGRAYTEACARLADRIVFVSEGIRASVPARHARKFRTVYNGVLPPAAPGRGREELLGTVDLPDDRLLVVAVGSLVPFKGVHHLIAAARDVNLVLVGDRPDEAYGRHLDRLAGPRVRFAGWDDRAGDWQAAADVVCLPTVDEETLELEGARLRVTHTEGLSRTVLEAMALGKAIVATRVAGAPEQLVDGESGLLVPPSSPGALAGAFARLAADPSLRARLGEAAAARARERFSIGQAVLGTMAVYAELGR